MHVHNLSEENSVLKTFISEIRDVHIQKDRMRFRRNIERIGEILSYEMSKTFHFQSRRISTPLGESTTELIDDEVVLCSILRAGLPLHNGLLNYLDMADNAFISAYRQHTSDTDFDIKVEYLTCPNLDNKTLVLADPMLATGQSLIAAFKALKPFGTPKNIHLVSVIGAEPGIELLTKYFPENTFLWIAAIDKHLNEKGYIIPGLGDAGDLAFGEKLQK